MRQAKDNKKRNERRGTFSEAATLATKAKLKQERAHAMDRLAKAHEEATNKRAAVTAAQKALQSARKTVEARAPGARGYQELAYWEERHARDSLEGTTYEWYTAYPKGALREVKNKRS